MDAAARKRIVEEAWKADPGFNRTHLAKSLGISRQRVAGIVSELQHPLPEANPAPEPEANPAPEPEQPAGWDAVLDAARNGLPPEACAMAGRVPWPQFKRQMTECWQHDPEVDPPLPPESARMLNFFEAVALGLNRRAADMSESVSGLNALQRATKDWQSGYLLPDPAPENALKGWNAYLDMQEERIGGTETQQQIVAMLRRFQEKGL